MRTLTTNDIQKQTVKFTQALRTATILEAELQAFYAHIQAEMEQHSIQSVKGHWGHLTLAKRKNWNGTNLPPRFYKKVLDTTKLNYLYKANETLPKGVSFTETTYLSKRIKGE